ncbi:MAG TPA: YraN family protein [Methylomusa anaerophila]|uniref:UPF0102 protein MAMMFC1_03917 n=1 Tax=Methylomusa anaerophila TaxID=1930071 RepID=A0A348AQ60_9FIRM|nr:YraN family protein [Methylomusa anaerophila]BBB93208.1 hypothetical protein MAMMFC1_03917 [Methylomusa anaerophila]HML86960.1 YraN family protein [Methylomusa anaerophila]
MRHLRLGETGEQAATDYLINHGYRILATKYRAKTGEIDIVARDKNDDCVVFVEVKTRRSTLYGVPAEAVGYKKQRKIMNTALIYMNQNGLTDVACRFDVIEIYWYSHSVNFNHIIGAFDCY